MLDNEERTRLAINEIQLNTDPNTISADAKSIDKLSVVIQHCSSDFLLKKVVPILETLAHKLEKSKTKDQQLSWMILLGHLRRRYTALRDRTTDDFFPIEADRLTNLEHFLAQNTRTVPRSSKRREESKTPELSMKTEHIELTKEGFTQLLQDMSAMLPTFEQRVDEYLHAKESPETLQKFESLLQDLVPWVEMNYAWIDRFIEEGIPVDKVLKKTVAAQMSRFSLHSIASEGIATLYDSIIEFLS